MTKVKNIKNGPKAMGQLTFMPKYLVKTLGKFFNEASCLKRLATLLFTQLQTFFTR